MMVLISAWASLGAVDDPADQHVAEDDWWLPEWVEPLPDVMAFYGPNPEGVPDQTMKLGAMLRWSDVNPAEGVYDWSQLENALSVPGRKIYLRLELSHVEHHPAWIRDKYPELDDLRFSASAYQDNWGTSLSGDHYPPWHPGIELETMRLLASFKESGLADHPLFAYSYIPGYGSWGEFGVYGVDRAKDMGLGPEDYMAWFERIIDAHVDAYGRHNAHKLMFTGLDYNYMAGGDLHWREVIGRRPHAYALAQGCSTRFGLLEKFDFLVGDMPNYGVPAVDIGDGRYFVVDDDAPLLADERRWIGTENEEIDNDNIPWKPYYQMKMTALKSLHVRANNVYMARHVWNAAPEIHTYMLKTLGRRWHNSPDAWVALREGRDHYQEWSQWASGFRGEWWVRNWERWLMQREVEPDGRTARVYQIQDTPVPYQEDAYEARRTMHEAGSDHIYFNVHDRWMHGGSNEVMIKITYRDDFPGTWRLEYDSANDGPYTAAPAFHNDNDGTWKTVSVTLDDAGFANRQNGGMDFRLYNGGDHDLTVRFVRVIRLTEDETAPGVGDLQITIHGQAPAGTTGARIGSIGVVPEANGRFAITIPVPADLTGLELSTDQADGSTTSRPLQLGRVPVTSR